MTETIVLSGRASAVLAGRMDVEAKRRGCSRSEMVIEACRKLLDADTVTLERAGVDVSPNLSALPVLIDAMQTAQPVQLARSLLNLHPNSGPSAVRSASTTRPPVSSTPAGKSHRNHRRKCSAWRRKA